MNDACEAFGLMNFTKTLKHNLPKKFSPDQSEDSLKIHFYQGCFRPV